MDSQLAIAASLGLCVVARAAGLCATGTWPLFPGVCMRVRVAITVALAATAMPAVLMAPSALESAGRLTPLAVVGELLLGTILGTAVACVTGAASWAFAMLAAACGLAEGDAADPEDADRGGIARLVWWIAAGGFLAAGGNRAIVGGLLGSFASLPVGTFPSGNAAAMAVEVPAVAFTLAVSLAMPVLAGIIAFHVATAIVFRVASLDPGPGLVQAAAGLLLLAVLYGTADSWIAGVPRLIETPLARCFGGANP